jgi:NADH-quinone oxidoreductase subunit C
MAKVVVDLLQKQFPDAILGTHAQHGDDTVIVAPASWKAVHEFLKQSPQIDMAMLVDLTAVDYPDREPRFEVVTHLYSLSKGYRIRVKAAVGGPDGDDAEIDSLADLWGSANWAERECYDMFGVRFAGHPDLRRILMYPEFEGYPLRKDYPAARIQPLVPYREMTGIEKLEPFGFDEGMSFGRQSHDLVDVDDGAESTDEPRQ